MINLEQAHLDIAAASHPGMSGKKNEDRFGIAAFNTGEQQDTPTVFGVLCDGIGGHRAGEVAAQIGVSTITEIVTASDGENPLETLATAIKRANFAIYQASLTDQGRKGMGATCACAWVIADRLYTASLGDSRIYLLRAGHILQLTTDHTWLQEAYDAGLLDEAQGDSHPNAHVIRRYLGSAKPPRPDFRLWFFEGEEDAEALENQGLLLEPADIVLLCSDGLTDLVSDEALYNAVKTNPLEQAPGALIDLANKRGGHDNITVVLMAVPSKPAEAVRQQRKRRWLGSILAGLVLLGLLAAALFFGLRWLAGHSDLPPATTPVVTQPLLLPTTTVVSLTLTPGLAPEETSLPEDAPSNATPQPSLTPWPTHTVSP